MIANDEYQVTTDGITIWVNHVSGSNVARFGRMGIDIHNTIDDQERTGVQCLHCTHGPVEAKDWETFKELMDAYFAIEITDKIKPERFR